MTLDRMILSIMICDNVISADYNENTYEVDYKLGTLDSLSVQPETLVVIGKEFIAEQDLAVYSGIGITEDGDRIYECLIVGPTYQKVFNLGTELESVMAAIEWLVEKKGVL